MAFKFSKLAVIIVIIVLLPATILLSATSPFGSTGVLLVLLLWILIPVIIAKIYWQIKGVEET